MDEMNRRHFLLKSLAATALITLGRYLPDFEGESVTDDALDAWRRGLEAEFHSFSPGEDLLDAVAWANQRALSAPFDALSKVAKRTTT